METLREPRSEPEARGAWTTYLWAALAGLLVPILIVLVGIIAVLLDSRGLNQSEVRLGTHLSVYLPSHVYEQPHTSQLMELVAMTFMMALMFSLAVWMHRRDADARARLVVQSLHRKVLKQSLRRAEVEGAAAQYVRAEQLISTHMPRIQKGLSMWYRAIPRSLLMLVGCVMLALLVNVWLALVAVVSGVFVWWLYHRLRHTEGDEITHWQVPRSRKRMAEIVGQAPLLARLQTQGLADRAFETELESLYRRLSFEESKAGRVWPLLFVAMSISVAILFLGFGANVLIVDNGLSVPAALVLGLALTGAVVSGDRLAKLSHQLQISSQSTDAVYRYLERGDDIAPSEQRVGLAALRQSVKLADVTLIDSTGKPILQNLSLTLQPTSFVAVLGTEDVSTRALTELMMGFGRPSEGQISIDGIPILDIHPQALARNVMWVEPSGPLWDGTIEENLRGGDDTINNSVLVDVLEQLDIYDLLGRLPEGLNTYVSAGETLNQTETTFAIGVARALLHRPSIVIAVEPPPPAEHLPEDPCLNGLKRLAQSGSLVLVLPRRIQTLRSADRVILLNGPRLAGEGNHADLLSGSDLYRHLNYLLFNPYRHHRGE